MSRKCVASFASGVAVVLASTVALAHHGTNASYDARKEATLTGVVTKFIMVNPHGQLFNKAIRDPAGGVVK